MSAQPRFHLELEPPKLEPPCECCGGLTVRHTGFISDATGPYAVYYSRYSNTHPDHELHLIVSIGGWATDRPEERVAFFCRVRPMDGSYGVMVDDAADSIWGDVELLGAKLSREEALAHPLKTTFFELTDLIGDQDPSIDGYFSRIACGASDVPLELSFGWPDEVFALSPETREARAVCGRNFVSLDDERFFMRGLMQIPVEKSEPWSVGVWLEMSRDDYERAKAAWDHRERYAALRVDGRLATNLRPHGLPAGVGEAMRLFVESFDEAPRVRPVQAGELKQLYDSGWTEPDFIQFAVARGYL